MAAKKTIKLHFPTCAQDDLGFKIWIFAEDVWREIERGGLGDVGGTDGVDAVGDTPIVRIKHTRKIGRVRKAVEKLLKKHFLYDAAEMTYE